MSDPHVEKGMGEGVGGGGYHGDGLKPAVGPADDGEQVGETARWR